MLHSLADYLSAIILLFVVGTAIGNYATSLVYRLPRGLKIAYDPPYCDSCRTYLTTRDMFPFFSWVLSRGKCRTCGAKVPGVYTVIEFLCAVFLIAGVILFDSPERMLLVSSIGVFWLVMVSILFTAERFSSHAVILAAASGLIYRAVEDGSIFPAIKAGYLGLMLGLVCWGVIVLAQKLPLFKRKLDSSASPEVVDETSKAKRFKTPMPPITMLLAIACLTVGTSGIPYILIWTPTLYLFVRGTSCVIDPTLKDWAGSWAIFGALMLTLYCPGML